MNKKIAFILCPIIVAIILGMAFFVTPIIRSNQLSEVTITEFDTTINRTTEEPITESIEEEPIATNLSLKVMSFNVRTTNVSQKGYDNWYNRRAYLVKEIQEANPDIIGFQEVIFGKTDVYLLLNLPQYAKVGIQRDGQFSIGSEGTPIFYNKDKFELLETKTFWLSETPDIVSYGWDAACKRVCTYATFKDKASGKEFTHYNTHFDHKGDEAVKHESDMMLDIVKANSLPSFLTGDFNLSEGSKIYKKMVEYFEDSKFVADETMSSKTYHAYNDSNMNGKPIDFCMLKPDTWHVKSYKVLPPRYEGVFTSDHCALLVEMELL